MSKPTVIITNIEVQTIPSKNILPNGTRDLTADTWCFGGTTYKVSTESNGTFDIQVETLTNGMNVFYYPNHATHSASLHALLADIVISDTAMEEHYAKNCHEE